MVSADVNEWREWKKKHPDFPLTVAPCGQWCKKVRGRTRYFGLLRDPQGALAEWIKDRDYLLAGLEPPALDAGTTAEELLNIFLSNCDDRIGSGTMTRRGKASYVALKPIFRAAGVNHVSVRNLGPEHFAKIRRAISDGRSLRTQKNYIVGTRTLFKWAADMEYIESVHFGPEFKAPPSDKIEAEQEDRCRFIDRETILSAMKLADQKMRVAILLGINCAFGPGDTVAITTDHIHLDSEIPYHEFRRTKNSRKRAAVLWPETVVAIRGYMEGDRRPKVSGEKRLILANGVPYGRHGDMTLAAIFRGILNECGGRKAGVGLGSLRHTYATVIDRYQDDSMIDLTMGHVGKGLRRRVYKQLNLDEFKRLQSAAEVVRKWLWPAEQPACPEDLQTAEVHQDSDHTAST